MANEKLLNSSLLQEYDTQREYHLPTELSDLDYKTICTFKITSANTTISPTTLTGLTKIIWGDGTVDIITSETTYSHTYVDIGTYTAVFEGVTKLGTFSFRDISALIDIKISKSVTSIGNYTFSGTSLTSITIPDSVTSIGTAALPSILNKAIIFRKTPPILHNVISGSYPIYVPLESLQAYKTATNWVASADRIRAIVDTTYLETAYSASALMNQLFDVSVVEGV